MVRVQQKLFFCFYKFLSRRTNKMVQKQLNLEGVRIGFRNFEGREGMYNKAGDRSFAVFISDKDAKKLEREGWNIKWPKERPDSKDEEDTREPYLMVSVGFDFFPAKAYLITPQNDSDAHIALVGEAEVGMLDWAELSNVDLVIRPYNWTVSGKSGVKAYLKAGYFTLITDDFAKKYGI